MIYKQYAKLILSNRKLIKLLGDNKVHYQTAIDPKPPYIVYQFYDERNVLSAEGLELITRHSLQIDIYSVGDYSEIEAVLKEILSSVGWFKRSVFEDYDSKTKLYFKALRYEFDLIKE